MHRRKQHLIANCDVGAKAPEFFYCVLTASDRSAARRPVCRVFLASYGCVLPRDFARAGALT